MAEVVHDGPEKSSYVKNQPLINKVPMGAETVFYSGLDLPVVQVNGSLEKAIRDLKRRMRNAGTIEALKRRKLHPTTSDRRRRKRAEAIGRSKAERRKKQNV